LTALIINNALWLVGVLAVWRIHISFERERAEAQRQREDELINRIQAPQVAVAQSLASDSHEVPFVSSSDDEAAAKWERERQTLEQDTRAFIEEFSGVEK
jgi:hypothetical protein